MAKQNLPPQSPVARAEAKKKYEEIFRRYHAGEELGKLLKTFNVGEAAYHKWRRTYKKGEAQMQRGPMPRPVAAFGGDAPRRSASGSQLILCSMEALNRIVSEAVDEALRKAVAEGRIKTVDL